jgi:hypothetical protein
VTCAAARDGGVQITINGGAGRYVTHAELAGDQDQPAVETTTSISPRETRYIGGTSAKELVRLAGVGLPALADPPLNGAAMTVTFAGDRSPPVSLTAAEVRDGLTGDPLGPRQATFDAGYSSVVRFTQPLRAGASRYDYVESPLDRDLLVDINTTGHALQVQLSASSLRIEHGESVSFSATVSPAPSGSSVTYDWDFEGNDEPVQLPGPAGSHVYAVDGSYTARLTVTTDDGSSGTDAVAIQVGTPAAGGTSNTPAPPAAGTGGGGAAAGGGPAASGGGSATPGAPSRGPARGRRTSTSSGHKAKTPAASRKKPDRRTAVRPTPPASPATGARRADGARRPATGAADRTRDPATPPPSRVAGVPIRGILLSGTSPFQSALPALEPAPADALARSAARAAAGSPGGLLGWLAGGALTIAVLISGALVEMRALARRALRPVTPTAA